MNAAARVAHAVAWLPVLHTERPGGWRFTALHSNTARAHDLGKERDWVVVTFHGPDGPESQCTVVTETRGELAGTRVVRGCEAECGGDGRRSRGRRARAGDGHKGGVGAISGG